MKLYPLFADLCDRRVLVVGGGLAAERQAAALLEAGAQVTVGAPALTDALRQLAEAGRLNWRREAFRDDWLDAMWLVVLAADDGLLHQHIAALARRRQLFVTVVGDVALSTFHVPGVSDSASFGSTNFRTGVSMIVPGLRERLARLLDRSVDGLATLATRLRQRVERPPLHVGVRQPGHAQQFAEAVPELPFRGQSGPSPADAVVAAGGSVVLVGAGPGDPGLLTLRALRAMNEADVILHDRLVSAEVLQLARPDVERIEVGKQAGNHHTSQEGIHALLLEHARAGRRVVRLKGGDPFVFGRGGEELEFLRAHSIPYEVVPGITAAVACAAYAGIPLTHRDHAQSVRFITAHCQSSRDTLDWQALAQERQTLAVYMGVAELGALQQRMLEHGRAASTPFALIENGSRPQQRVITGTLGQLAQRAQMHAVQSPALLILGEVAALAAPLAWFGRPPIGANLREPPPALPLRPAARAGAATGDNRFRAIHRD